MVVDGGRRNLGVCWLTRQELVSSKLSSDFSNKTKYAKKLIAFYDFFLAVSSGRYSKYNYQEQLLKSECPSSLVASVRVVASIPTRAFDL